MAIFLILCIMYKHKCYYASTEYGYIIEQIELRGRQKKPEADCVNLCTSCIPTFVFFLYFKNSIWRSSIITKHKMFKKDVRYKIYHGRTISSPSSNLFSSRCWAQASCQSGLGTTYISLTYLLFSYVQVSSQCFPVPKSSQ